MPPPYKVGLKCPALLTLLYTGYKMLWFTMGPPLENDSRNHFWGQIDLRPKMYVKMLEDAREDDIELIICDKDS